MWQLLFFRRLFLTKMAVLIVSCAIRLPTLVLLVSQGRGHSNSLSACSSSARIHHLPTKHRIKNKNLYSITTSNKGRDCSPCKVAYAGEFKSLVMAMALQSCRSFESILEDWIGGRHFFVECTCSSFFVASFCDLADRLFPKVSWSWLCPPAGPNQRWGVPVRASTNFFELQIWKCCCCFFAMVGSRLH